MSAIWLEDILEVASERSRLNELVYQLTPDEVKIARTYVENLVKTRPIKEGK